MENAQNLWSVPVAVDDIPETGLHIETEAPAEVRAQLVKLANLRDLPRLSAVFDLSRRGGGVHVAGQVRARVGQTCVVTLEPIENEIEEAVDLTFVPAAASEAPDDGGAGRSRVAAEDAPEPLLGGAVDLGLVATEFLTLAIDPYPRKSGAAFSVPAAGDDDAAHPFAALAALKKGQGGP